MPDLPGGPISRRRALKITAVAGISTAFLGSVTAGLLRIAGLQRFESTRSQMGTRVTIAALHPDAEEARALVDAAFEEMERLENILSRHRSGTALDQLNRQGSLQEAPPELLHILERARAFSELSDGAFDATIAPLLRLYEHAEVLPRPSEVARARSLVDYREVHVRGRNISFGKPGMAVTLDGLAKGFIVDRATEGLRSGGIDQVMVEAGGDVASTRGSAVTEGWRVAVQDPRDSQGILGIVRLDGQAVATSGDYAQTFSDDPTLHHILDPRTGRSPQLTSSVTVIAPTAMEADALSTTAFVMGAAKGLRLLEQLEGIEGLIVNKLSEAETTSGFARYSA